jgi:hypothetical protein
MLGLVLGAFLSVFGFNSVYAQVPRNISYQGLLVKNGNPVNTPVNINVTIYDAAGTVLYQESETGVPVVNGLFTILIGGKQAILPPSLKFDEQYYLGVDVEGTGELQRTPFSAAPYALNSQTVGGVGVSATPSPGMLLALDANGKFPKSVLPTSSQASLNTIDGVSGDANGNIKFTTTTPGLFKIIDNPGSNSIELDVLQSSGGITAVQAGPGLTGGGAAGIVTLSIANNGITNGMLGNGVVSARNLDQNIPQFGLYMDQFGQLNVGIDTSFAYYHFGTTASSTSPASNQPMRNIGLNLAHTNIWTALQVFNGGLTGTFGILGTLGVNGTYLTVNGLAEPLATANGATYEVIDNGDALVTGSVTVRGNTFIGVGPSNSTNQMGLAATSVNTITGATNNVTGSVANNIQSPANSIGTSQAAGGTNQVGTASISANTVTGITNVVNASTTNTVTAGTANAINAGTTNTLTATTSNNLVSAANNIGTTTANSVNTIGNAGTSSNTVTGTTNTVTATTGGNTITATTGNNTLSTVSGINNIQAPTNNVGTTQVAGGVNNIGSLGNSTNNIFGLTNNSQATTVNISTAVASNTTNIGTASGDVVNIGNTANNTVTLITGLTSTMNATTNNIGTQSTAVVNNIGTGGTSTNNVGTATSTNTINGTTTFNGNVTHNGNITQTSGSTVLLTTQTGNLTVVGTLTQSGGNANIAGGPTNTFGSVASSNNTIGGTGSTNTITGGTNNMVATSADNLTAPTITLTGNTTATGGTFTSTGNSFIGTTSTTNVIGNAGNSSNTMTGQTNTFTATTGGNTFTVSPGAANNFTGDIVQASGRVSIAPSASTVNNFGFGGSGQTNNFGTGPSATNTIGSGNGSVNNLGVTTGGGISTNNIGNLNAGTNNNVNGTTTFQGATLTGADGNQILRITGGPQSCAGALPTALTSQLFADGDVWFGGTASACRLNVFGAGASCISNLNTTTFGACAGGATKIVLISGINGNSAINGSPINFTNIDNIQANTNITANVYFTTGTGVATTNISPALAGSRTLPTTVVAGQDNTAPPSVSGRMPTFQTYTATLIPGTGPHGGGAVSITNVPGTPNASAAPFPASGTEMGLNFDNNSSITVTYRQTGALGPMGVLNVTTSGTTYITVESSAAGDNNTIQITILRP